MNSTLVVPPTTPFPKKLIYAIDPTAEANQSSPGFFPVTNNASQAIYDAFVVKLEKHIGVKKTNYDLCGPALAHSTTFSQTTDKLSCSCGEL